MYLYIILLFSFLFFLIEFKFYTHVPRIFFNQPKSEKSLQTNILT